MYSTTSTSEEKVLITLNPSTSAGNPAVVDSAPAWNLLEGDCTLVPAQDGMSCELISGASGVINQIEVTADGDMTEGVRSISEIIVYTVTAPEAANLGISSTVSLK